MLILVSTSSFLLHQAAAFDFKDTFSICLHWRPLIHDLLQVENDGIRGVVVSPGVIFSTRAIITIRALLIVVIRLSLLALDPTIPYLPKNEVLQHLATECFHKLNLKCLRDEGELVA